MVRKLLDAIARKKVSKSVSEPQIEVCSDQERFYYLEMDVIQDYMSLKS